MLNFVIGALATGVAMLGCFAIYGIAFLIREAAKDMTLHQFLIALFVLSIMCTGGLISYIYG